MHAGDSEGGEGVVIWMVLGASLPGLCFLVLGMWKVRAARRMKAAAEVRFGEAAMSSMVAQAKLERAVVLCKYADKCMEVGRQHNERARKLLDGRGEF